jgi:hypothetical protein
MLDDYRAVPKVLYTGMAKIACKDKFANEIGSRCIVTESVTEVMDYEERISRI